jgi:hypothetical protein
MSERITAHYSDVAVNLLGLWEHRGNVELYFKHRYQPFNYRIGNLTEYFAFPFVKAVLQDLYEMKPQVRNLDSELKVICPVNCPVSDWTNHNFNLSSDAADKLN